MNKLPKIRRNMIDLGTGWIILNNEEDNLMIEFNNGAYLILEFDTKNKNPFSYLQYKPAIDQPLVILTKDILLKIEKLPELVIEKIKKDGNTHEPFLNYIKNTIKETLFFNLNKEKNKEVK